MEKGKKSKWESKYIRWGILVLIAAGAGAVGYVAEMKIKQIDDINSSLEAMLGDMHTKNQILEEALVREQSKNTDFQNQISDITNAVGRLDKLSKTDKELLQKYSKVYFLNENYVPEDLTAISTDYIFNKKRAESVHTKVYPFLRSMLLDAKNQGVDLLIISAYRSFEEQKSLKSSYAFTYGSGANKFSADQGYSEHQLGTTLDLTTAKLGSGYTAFKNSEGYKWMQDNAYKYGFILSYPEGNSYYQFEPWHWRFVGKSLAMRLHEEKQNFYDMDQRVIDNYLINIFD